MVTDWSALPDFRTDAEKRTGADGNGSAKDNGNGTDNLVLVSIERPMGIAFEQTRGGVIYVAEVVDGSNAEGMIPVGVEVVSVSLPFGDTVFPIAGKGIDEFESYLMERDEKEKCISLEYRQYPGGLEALLEASYDGQVGEIGFQDAMYMKKKIANLPYPVLQDEESFEEPSGGETELDASTMEMLSKMSVEEKRDWFKENYKP
ncbi:hypothetical protein NDN08_006054 [Rhodosorus marinus]|uniref:PDZ domain-containing protein n=1 Tax=Rhodosorus marinus TaxID=101924 RepID=A0AAV8UJQ0_9RHOD|nr:hypothetical protein NDN08_006054 [Rhodosorus marinus]